MVPCDSRDRHMHDLSLKRSRYRIECLGRAQVFYLYVFCVRYRSSRDSLNV